MLTASNRQSDCRNGILLPIVPPTTRANFRSLLAHEIHVAGPYFRPVAMATRGVELRDQVVGVCHALRGLGDIVISIAGEPVRGNLRASVGLDRAVVGDRRSPAWRAILAMQMAVAHGCGEHEHKA